MTINYKALAGRIKTLADRYEDSSLADGLREKIVDLRAVVTMLRGMAEAKPVAWMDEFGNAFPLDAWKPAKRTGYLDYHKKAWKPLFTHPAPQPQRERQPVMHKPSGFTFDSVIAAVNPDDLMRLTPEAEAYERAARVCEPKGPRPCDCTSCDCGNYGDAQRVAQWDEATARAAEIRSLMQEQPK